MRRRRLIGKEEDNDPMSVVGNLFDVAMVFAVALMVALVTRYDMTEMFSKEDFTIVKNPGQENMEIITKEGERISRYTPSENQDDASGRRGRRVGVAYELEDGEIIYVPDSCKYQQHDDGVPAVFLQELPVDEAEGGQCLCQNRKFEDKAHDEDHQEEVAHVGVQRYLVDNAAPDLVFRKESECERKDYAVADGTAEIEHRCAEYECRADAFLFPGIQGGADEFPDFINDIGENSHSRQPERCADVCREL